MNDDADEEPYIRNHQPQQQQRWQQEPRATVPLPQQQLQESTSFPSSAVQQQGQHHHHQQQRQEPQGTADSNTEPLVGNSNENIPVDLDEFPSVYKEEDKTGGIPTTVFTTPYDDVSTIAADTIGNTVMPCDMHGPIIPMNHPMYNQQAHYQASYLHYIRQQQQLQQKFEEELNGGSDGDGLGSLPHSKIPPQLLGDGTIGGNDTPSTSTPVSYSQSHAFGGAGGHGPAGIGIGGGIGGSVFNDAYSYTLDGERNGKETEEEVAKKRKKEKKLRRCYLIAAIVGPIITAIIVGLTIGVIYLGKKNKGDSNDNTGVQQQQQQNQQQNGGNENNASTPTVLTSFPDAPTASPTTASFLRPTPMPAPVVNPTITSVPVTSTTGPVGGSPMAIPSPTDAPTSVKAPITDVPVTTPIPTQAPVPSTPAPIIVVPIITFSPTPSPIVTPSPTPAPVATPNPTEKPEDPKQTHFLNILQTRSVEYYSDLLDEISEQENSGGGNGKKALPRYEALQWMINDPNYWTYSISTDNRLLQRYVLAVFAYGLERLPSSLDDNNASNNYWLDYNIHECDWYSTSSDPCSSSSRLLRRLDIRGNGNRGSNGVLVGTVPNELAILSNTLEWIYMPWNQLQGTIPTSLSELTLLERLQLTSNELVGTIPSELGLMNTNGNNNLVVLGLGRNDLTGTLPQEISSLGGLTTIGLERTQLTGTIPFRILGRSLTNLNHLYLDHNRFTGEIPTFVRGNGNANGNSNNGRNLFPALEEVNIGYNDFSGAIDDSNFCGLSNGGYARFVADCDPTCGVGGAAEISCDCCTECSSDGC